MWVYPHILNNQGSQKQLGKSLRGTVQFYNYNNCFQMILSLMIKYNK